MPAFSEAKCLRDKFRIHQSARAGLDGQILQARRCSLDLGNPPHLVDFLYPIL